MNIIRFSCNKMELYENEYLNATKFRGFITQCSNKIVCLTRITNSGKRFALESAKFVTGLVTIKTPHTGETALRQCF